MMSIYQTSVLNKHILQTIAFFENAAQMAIPHETMAALSEEGIDTVHDLGEFGDNELVQISKNLRRPAGQIVDPNDANRMISRPPFVLGAKSFMRLKVATDAVRYYEMVGRDPTSANMHNTNVLKTFADHWKSLEDYKKEDVPDVPKISKNLYITRWTESFQDFLSLAIGQRHM